MAELTITTTDKNFANDLKAANIEGLKISQRVFFKDAADVKPVLDEILKFTIGVSGNIALGLFVNWLYDKIRRNSKEKTVINGNVISADTVQIGQITQIIINTDNAKNSSNPN